MNGARKLRVVPDQVIDRTYRPRRQGLSWVGWLVIFAAAYAALGVLT